MHRQTRLSRIAKKARSRSRRAEARRATRARLRKKLERAYRLFLTRGLTHQEIADKVGLPRRSVSRYINKRQAGNLVTRSSAKIAGRRDLDAYFRVPKRVTPSLIRRSDPGLYASVMISLTARQRQTFLHYFEQGLKAPEVAELLKVGRSAVTRQIIRIRKAFSRVGLPEPKHFSEGGSSTRLRSLSRWSSDSY